MKVIEGKFNKDKDDDDKIPTVKETLQNILEAEDIDTFDRGFAFAFREDGLTVFSANMDSVELYMLLDQIKDYLRGNYD